MEMLSPVNYEQVDPGIRDTVRMLANLGFVVTESGDGVSKPKDCYEPDENGVTPERPYPHVVCLVKRLYLYTEAERLQGILGPDWIVEGTYLVNAQQTTLFAWLFQMGKLKR